MARVTLTVSDLDLAAGDYKVDFKAEGNEIDDGQATAAYFTGFYLNTIVNTPDFLEGVRDYGQTLIDAMLRSNAERVPTENPAAMVLTLTDQNLVTGRFSVTLHSEGGDPSGESLPTTAQVVGSYMRWLLGDMDFATRVWEFAEEYVANNGTAVIANDDQRPDYSPAAIHAA